MTSSCKRSRYYTGEGCPGKQTDGIYRDLYKRRFVIGIGSNDHGGREVPQRTSWGPRKARGIAQSECECLKMGWGNGSQAENANSPFLQRFALFGPLTDWMMPARTGEGHLLHSERQFKCSTLAETPSETSSLWLTSYQAALSPVKLTPKIHHHTHHLSGEHSPVNVSCPGLCSKT